MSAVSEMSRPVNGVTIARYLLWKPVLDWALASILLVLTAPVMLAAMALVRLTSRGPAIYWQRRLGLGGQPYTIYKIRTMYQDCERLTGPQWSTPGDPRITPVGRILRAAHVDELPQLWNVLRGEMSLVGPRPERPEIAAELERVLPNYRGRLLVRPGVTGLAQVQLPPDISIESVCRKLACDVDYIRRVGFWLDLRIMIATAMGALGLSFAVSRRLLRIPTSEVTESADHDLSVELDIWSQSIEPESRETCELLRIRGDDVAETPDRLFSGELGTPPQGVEPMPQINPA